MIQCGKGLYRDTRRPESNKNKKPAPVQKKTPEPEPVAREMTVEERRIFFRKLRAK